MRVPQAKVAKDLLNPATAKIHRPNRIRVKDGTSGGKMTPAPERVIETATANIRIPRDRSPIDLLALVIELSP